MPKAKKTMTETLSTKLAKTRRRIEKNRAVSLIGGRGAATLLVGAALSIGGVAETLDNVHFLVQKDLDSVRVIRKKGDDQKVVASMAGNFTGNTVYKLAQVLPDRVVTRELSMFDESWFQTMVEAEAVQVAGAPQKKRDVFLEEMVRINSSIRREFFETSMPFGELIHEKAEKYDVDPILVAAVIEQESRFKPRAKSHVGARGLMQLMPRTGRWMGARNLYDPEQNIDAGVKYIKYLDKRFKGNMKLTIAAYNGGEGNVKRYRGVPPFRETRQYVKKVMKNYDRRTKELKKFEAEQLRGGSIPEEDGTLTLR